MSDKAITFSREGYLNEDYRYFHLKDTAGQERDFHFHDFDKIVLLISGRVDYAVEDRVYPLEPWSVLLIKRHTIHKALIDKKEPYERIIIYLDGKFFDRSLPQAGLMACFDSTDKAGQHLLIPDEGQRASISEAAAAFEKALGEEGFGSQAMRDTLMMQLLIHINRLAADRAAEPAADRVRSGINTKIDETLSYINEHLSQEMSVDMLAERVFLSRYHFMRLFKAQTGSTVHAYVRQKRLLCAARLIREGVSASQAALDSGFTDYSAFHRAFKECFGISPGKLKG